MGEDQQEDRRNSRQRRNTEDDRRSKDMARRLTADTNKASKTSVGAESVSAKDGRATRESRKARRSGGPAASVSSASSKDERSLRESNKARRGAGGSRSGASSSTTTDERAVRESRKASRASEKGAASSSGASNSTATDERGLRESRKASRVAGAVPSTSTNTRESRKHRSRRNAAHDRKSTAASPTRAAHSSRTPSTPGTRSNKNRTTEPAATPGVDRIRDDEFGAASPNGNDGAIQAEAVDENVSNEAAIEKEVQARMQRLMQNQQQPAENPNTTTTNDDKNKEPEVEEVQPKSKWKCIALVVLILAIGGGVAAYFLLTSSNGDETPPSTTEEQPKENVDPTSSSPTEATITESPTKNPGPAPAPMQAPTIVFAHDPPDAETCETIRNPEEGVDRSGTSQWLYDIGIDVSFDGLTAPDGWVETLAQALQENFVPALAGCNRLAERRRRLQSLRYLIADAVIESTTKSNGDCKTPSPFCKNAILYFEFYLKSDDVRNFDVVKLLGEIIEELEEEHGSFVKFVGLSSPLVGLKVVKIQNLEPTVAPSFHPSTVPSFLPSMVPTKAPTTGTPTISPSTRPSIQGSSSPTSPPTPSPTRPPTKFPTRSPTKRPTPEPTPGPTFATPNPSQKPTISPSATPSIFPNHCFTETRSCATDPSLESVTVQTDRRRATYTVSFCSGATETENYRWKIHISTLLLGFKAFYEMEYQGDGTVLIVWSNEFNLKQNVITLDVDVSTIQHTFTYEPDDTWKFDYTETTVAYEFDPVTYPSFRSPPAANTYHDFPLC